jgi:hypothetical protein
MPPGAIFRPSGLPAESGRPGAVFPRSTPSPPSIEADLIGFPKSDQNEESMMIA